MRGWVWKVLLGLVLAAVLLSLPSPAESDAVATSEPQDGTVSGDFVYSLKDEEMGTVCILTSYLGNGPVVYVPSELGGYPVSVVDTNCFASRADITEVYLPDTVVIVQKQAFFYCEKLETVHFQEGLEYIGEMAFYGCECLKTLTLPSTVYGWGSFTFFLTPSLETLYLECESLQFDSRIEIAEASVFINSDIRLNDKLVITNITYNVELDQDMMDEVEGDYLEFSIKAVDKSLLDKKLKKAIGFADCYNLTMKGLPEGYQYEVKFGDHYDYHEGMVDHTIYVIEGGRLIDIGTFGPVESPSFHANATETMFCYSVSGGTIPYSPALGILIACIGTLMAYVYVRQHRGD